MYEKDKKSKYPGKTFPPHNLPNDEKLSMEYGMQVAVGISREWYDRENGATRFYKNRYKINKNRRYAVGDQSIQKYKDEFSINGDLSYLNLDFTPVPILPKFVDIVVNGMADREFSIQATAVDQTSTEQREKFVKRLRGEMKHRDQLAQLSEASGVNVFENNPNEMPKNNEELDLYLELDYKHGSEIAIEKSIEYIFKNNKFEEVKYRFDYDLVTLGIGCVKHEFCPVEGVKIKYVDPENLVYSDTENRFMNDGQYFGEVRRVHITQVQKEFPHLSQMDIDRILQLGNSTINQRNTQQSMDSTGSEDYVDLLYFCYKTSENEIYKVSETQSGGMKAKMRDEKFEAKKVETSRFEKTHRIHDTIFEGVSVFGADVLLKWEKAKNLVRPSFNSPKVMMPYIAVQTKDYKGKIYSLLDRMIKYADAIQLTHLKIQQVKQKMTPPGIFLDVDGLAEINLGNGTSYNPQEALNMYFQTGSVVGRSKTEENEYNHGKIPIQELPGGTGQQMQVLIGEYEYNINQIRQVTGLNEARDGSAPDPKALVGVQKLAAANSNVATRHILESSMYLTKEAADGCALRFKQVLEHSPRRDDFIQAVGRYNVELLDELKHLHHNEFGVFIELGPDAEEKERLEQDIQGALAKDLLKPEDRIDILRVKNYKLAQQMLKVKRKQREEAEQAANQANIQAQAQANAEAAQVAEQSKQQTIQVQTQMDVEKIKVEAQVKNIIFEAEKEKEIEILRIKHELDMERLGVEMMHSDDQMDKQAKLSNAMVDNKQNTVDGKVSSPGYIG